MKASVIGAGPAGLSAAIGLARSGFETTVYEQKKEWSGRVCGAFLSPESCESLNWLGVGAEAGALGIAAGNVAVYDPAGRRYDFSVKRGGIPALALPRKILEELLSKQAEKEGVKIERGVRKLAHELDSDVIVSAEGRFPPGRPQPKTLQRWYGMNAEFENTGGKPGDVSLHFFGNGYIGMLTYADGTTNVCGLARGKIRDETLEKILGKDARSITPWQGVGPLPFGCYIEKRSGGPWPVGDAAAVCDPFMGEGISRALAAGPMIREAFKKPGTSPALAYLEYYGSWNRSYRLRQNLGNVLRALSARGWTASLAISLFSRKRLQDFLLETIHS